MIKSLLPVTKMRDTEAAKKLSQRILKENIDERVFDHLHVLFWDGEYWPSSESRRVILKLNRPSALREMFLGGSETSLAEAYLSNACDIQGDFEAIFMLVDFLMVTTNGWSKKLKAAELLLQLPSAKDQGKADHRRAFLKGGQHSLKRDEDAIRFHYDLSNDFYALWLDLRMVYSCAYFQKETDDLETAQRQKLDHICRKLALGRGKRFLDIGCGWGGLILHAATVYGAKVLGITLSQNQADYVRSIINKYNLQSQVEVRVMDYRQLEEWESYDAIASVGMVEHVGRNNLAKYYDQVRRLLKPKGLFLNHGIGLGVVPRMNRGSSFIDEYVFPDSDLFSISQMVGPAEETGFEIRDVENLREHYALTLRQWVKRLERMHQTALQYVGEPIYRIWRLYMAGSAHGFHIGQLAVYQTLLVKLDGMGQATLPLTRKGWYSA